MNSFIAYFFLVHGLKISFNRNHLISNCILSFDTHSVNSIKLCQHRSLIKIIKK